MTKSPIDIYRGREPRDLPAYPPSEAAFLVGVPSATLRSWVFGRHYPVRATDRAFSPPVIRRPDPTDRYLSFTNLVEAHVLASIRTLHGVPLEAVRSAVEFVETRMATDHPLASGRFLTDGASLFVEHMGEVINASRSQQVALQGVMEARLRRVEMDERALACRLFPWLRAGDGDGRRTVMVDPRVSFGRPVVFGTGIPTAVLHQRFLGGDSISELAADYGVATDLIEDAIRCEEHRAA